MFNGRLVKLKTGATAFDMKLINLHFILNAISILLFAVWVYFFSRELNTWSFGSLLCIFCFMIGVIGIQERKIKQLKRDFYHSFKDKMRP